MAKKTYYGIFCRGKLVETKNKQGDKMPLIFLSKQVASNWAEHRTHHLKKSNTVKVITI